MPPLSDQGARDEIRTALDVTLFVEAGAGTGKTTVLVDRIVNLVRRGVEMRHLAAITFTEAAAAELRDRIRAELERAAKAEPALSGAMAEVDDAVISTLHAFAQRILSEHPLEAGLPPSVEVLDEIRSSLAFEQRWAEFLDHLLSDETYADIVLRGMATGLRWDNIEHMARVLGDHWDRLEDREGDTEGVSGDVPDAPVVSAAPVVHALRIALDAVSQCCADDDRLLRHVHTLGPLADRLEDATDELEILHVLDASGKLECNFGQKGNWKCDIAEVRGACAAAEAARVALLGAVRQHVLGSL